MALANEDVSGNVTMWFYPLFSGEDDAFWSEVVTEFNEVYPNVDVSVEIQPWTNRDQQIATALAAGRGLDIIYLAPDQIPLYVDQDALIPLDDILTDEEVADYTESALTAVTYKDQVWVAPILQTVNTIVYNTRLFEEAGIDDYPTTWEELRDQCDAFREQGKYVLHYSAADDFQTGSFWPLLWQAGGRIFSEDGESVAFDSPEGTAALEWLVDMFNNECISRSTLTRALPLEEAPNGAGLAAVDFAASAGSIPALIELWGEGVLEVGEPLTGAVQVGYGDFAGFSLLRQTQDRAAAEAWLHFVTSPEIMARIDGTVGYLAPKKSLADLHADDPILGQLAEFVPLMRGVPVHPQARQLDRFIREAVQAAVLGQKTPEQALDDAATQANQLIQRDD